MNLFWHERENYRVDSGGEFPGLKTAVFDHFWAVLGAYRGVKNLWKIGGNPPIGGKESTLRKENLKTVVHLNHPTGGNLLTLPTFPPGFSPFPAADCTHHISTLM